MPLIQERPHRLNHKLYIGSIAVAFTICLKERKQFFTIIDRFRTIETILLQSLQHFSCEAYVYLCMPDHAHLLLGGKNNDSDLYRCVKNFKQRSGYWFSVSKAGVQWQKDFYDHILRNDEDVEKQVKYILGNPGRKRLVEYWKDYPFKGSTFYDFTQWL